MKAKYIFLSALILVAVASAWASEPNELERLRTENTELKRVCEKLRQNAVKLRIEDRDQSQTSAELQKNTTEQQNKINRLEAKNAEQKEQINMLQKQVAILYNLCKDANIPIPIQDNPKRNVVAHSDIKGLSLPLSVGQVGYSSDVRIKQVIDGNNMLVTLTYYAPKDYYIQNGMRVYTSGPLTASKKIVWIKGINTVGFADDTPLKIENIALKITGTKQYDDTEGATTTVFLLEPVEVVD